MAMGASKGDQNLVIGLESLEPEPGRVPSANGTGSAPTGGVVVRPQLQACLTNIIVILPLDGSEAPRHGGCLSQCTGALDPRSHLVRGGGALEVFATLGLR